MGKKKNEKKDPRLEVSEKEFEEIKKKSMERDEFYAKWLKVHAEYENTRKRMEKEKFDHIKFANEGIIAQLFPIMDNFDMAFDAMDKTEDKSAIMTGIRLVQKEFHRILEDNGVGRIETKDKVFDPNFHEAIAMVETEDHSDGVVIEEVRSGYTLNGRLLRAAQVKVAKKGS
ncbi:MAG: nucleotide exchange factor GrpE [Candidatus Omnitrophica bacterium]|nr:nucleotide exchange factor GrpE [Candidatus Omnitrophota bacterium]